MRFVFFLLLVANTAFAAHVWLSESKTTGDDPARREINPETLRIVAVTDAASVAKTAARVNAVKQLAESLANTACIELGRIKPEDALRAQQVFSAMNLGSRLSERKVEEGARFAVYLPPAKDSKTAETTVAFIKKLGVKDVLMLADRSISLGLFSTDEAASRHLAEVKSKGVNGAVKEPRPGQIREYVFTVREPDTQLVARLTLLQQQFEGSALKAAACQADQMQAVQAPAAQAQTAPANGATKR